MPVRSGLSVAAQSRRCRGPARRLGATLVMIAGLSLIACAAKDRPSPLVEPGGGADAEVPLAQGSPLEEMAEEDADYDAGDDASAKDVALEDLDGADVELALADYERLLVEQELRLRSAGLMLRGDEVASAGDGDAGVAGGIGAGGTPTAPMQEPPASSPGLIGKAGTAPPESKSKPNTTRTKTKKKKSKKSSSKSGGGSVGAGRASPSQRDDGADRCVMICDLAQSTCDLERRICELASRHPDDERYAQVCARASDDCDLARSACASCPV